MRRGGKNHQTDSFDGDGSLDKSYGAAEWAYREGRPDGLQISCPPTPESQSPMSMKHRRGNKETKKPKQNKPKAATSVSPFAPPAPQKAATIKRK